jgi:hypothetical protein
MAKGEPSTVLPDPRVTVTTTGFKVVTDESCDDCAVRIIGSSVIAAAKATRRSDHTKIKPISPLRDQGMRFALSSDVKRRFDLFPAYAVCTTFT